MVAHRIGPNHRFGIDRLEIPHSEAVPIGMEALIDILKVLEIRLEGRHFDLNEPARFEIHGLALG